MSTNGASGETAAGYVHAPDWLGQATGKPVEVGIDLVIGMWSAGIKVGAKPMMFT